MAAAIPQIAVRLAELTRLVDRTRDAPLTESEHTTLKAAIDTLGYIAQLLEQRGTTLARLRRLLWGTTTEKTDAVLERAGVEPSPADPPRDTGDEAGRAPPTRRGHGRNGAAAYAGARHVPIPHAQLHHGDRCPHCVGGTVYTQRDPGVLIRLIGQAPIAATIYDLEKLRCHLCGEVFTAEPPADAGPEKYDATAAAMVALLKYGSGVPFYRLAQLQAAVQIPLPASTQWEIVAALATRLQPVRDELIRQAAQGQVLYNDDTSMRVLGLRPGSPDWDRAEVAAARTGTFTSGIVATTTGHRVALFFTGRQHAGENLRDVLAHRAQDLEPPIQMCDALSRNPPKAFEVILAHCLAHARRHFVEVTPSFPDECRYVLETLRDVYAHDAQARAQQLAPDARLAFHQTHSGPVMAALQTWLTAQFDDRRVEPNSGLGKAITYVLNHWTTLTRFLTVPGAPLDSNLVERALKLAILHRKNAYFYKTSTGAAVGDLFMSLMHTCQLNHVNPFDYLTELHRHADVLQDAPDRWLPWTYRETGQPRSAAPMDSG